MYSSVADVRGVLLPGAGADPTDDKTTAASLSNQQIADAIAEADATINLYLSIPGEHQVPLDVDEIATPPVRYWSRNIAAFLATLTFRKGKDLGENDPVRLRYTDTMTALIAIRDGKMDNPLPLPDAPSNLGSQPLVLNQYDTDLPGGGLFSPADFFGPVNTRRIGQQRIWPG